MPLPIALMKAVLRALCCAAIFVASPTDAIVIRVSPDGNTSATLNDLAKDLKASASLARAIALLKSPELRDVSRAPKESITLQLVSGIYRLSDTIKLDESCSGSALNPVIIQGAPDSQVIITGGRVVSGFVPVNDQQVLKRLTSDAASHVLQTSLINQGITDFGKQSRHGFGGDAGNPTALTLTYNNQPMTLARWPNEDFANIGSTPDGEKGATFTVKKANLASWVDEPHLLATGYWFNNWADTTLPIQSVDVANNLTDRIDVASDRRDLEPIYSFNDEDLWTAGGVAKAGKSSQIRLWRGLIEKMDKEQRM